MRKQIRTGAGQRIEMLLVGENRRFAVKAIFRSKDADVRVCGPEAFVESVKNIVFGGAYNEVVTSPKNAHDVIATVVKRGFRGCDKNQAADKIVEVFGKLDVKPEVKAKTPWMPKKQWIAEQKRKMLAGEIPERKNWNRNQQDDHQRENPANHEADRMRTEDEQFRDEIIHHETQGWNENHTPDDDIPF